MKTSILWFLLLIGGSAFSQGKGETIVDARLYLPLHIKQTISLKDTLFVYFTTFPDDAALQIPKRVIAKRVRENVYQFPLPMTKLWQVGFRIKGYSYSMRCVNNRKGTAMDDYDFVILLEDKAVDFTNIQFLPPCINDED